VYKVAVVNSKSFGVRAPDLLEELRHHAQVDFIEVSKTVRGRELAEAELEYSKLAGEHPLSILDKLLQR